MRPTLVVFVRIVRLALCAAIAGGGALAAQEWRGPEDLEVRVEDAKGRPLAGAEVVLEYATREVGGPAPLLTDAKGRLGIGGLAPGRWALEVRKPGFMSFRAEIALSGGEKPEIVVASQHNVPGAVSTLRVRIGRTRGAPPAPARVELATAAPARPAEVAKPPSPPPSAVASPAAPARASVATTPPSAPAQPVAPPAGGTPPAVAPPAVTAAPAPLAPPARPSPVALPPTTPVATEARARVEAAAAPGATAPPVATPPPTAAPMVVAPVAPAPPPLAPPARVHAAAPISRACYECRPGESALLAEAETAAGGAPCPGDLGSRLASVPLAELPALAAALPSGCALLVIELPRDARYAGFRYEAGGGNGRSEDCLAGRTCPAGACRFPSEPWVRREEGATTILTLFESSAARRAGFTVYWRRTR